MAYSAILPWPWTARVAGRVRSRADARARHGRGLVRRCRCCGTSSVNLPGLATRRQRRDRVRRRVRRPAQLDRRWRSGGRPRPASLDRLKPFLPPVLAYLTLVADGRHGRRRAGRAGRDRLAAPGGGWRGDDRPCSSSACSSAPTSSACTRSTAIASPRLRRRQQPGRRPGRGRQPRRPSRATATIPRLTDLECRGRCTWSAAPPTTLSGDQVETLGRGARSAVLSRYGVSLGRSRARMARAQPQRTGSAPASPRRQPPSTPTWGTSRSGSARRCRS